MLGMIRRQREREAVKEVKFRHLGLNSENHLSLKPQVHANWYRMQLDNNSGKQ